MENNKVTIEQIRNLLDEATVEEHIFHNKELLLSFKLKCGFTVTGRAAVVDPANFKLDMGRKFAREDAENQMWKLEGYRLQWKLFEQ